MAAATTASAGAGGKAQPTFAEFPLAGKLLILVLILFVISVAYYAIFHQDLSSSIEGAHGQYAQLQQDMRHAQQRQQEFLSLTQELANREAVDRANKRVLPERAEIPVFLQDLNRIAELSGLSIQRVQPQAEVEGTSFVKIPVALEIDGRYHQFAKFFHSMAQIERAVSMEDVSLQVRGQRGGAPVPPGNGGTTVPDVPLHLQVLATTYRRATPPAQGAQRRRAAPGTTPPRGGR